MAMWRLGLGAVLGAWTLSCASIQNSYLARPIDERGQLSAERETPSGLVISGEESRSYASEYFGFVEVTLENTSTEWVRVRQMKVDFGNPEKDSGVYIPEGEDVDAWYFATVQRNDIQGTNLAAALGALMFVGATLAAGGDATAEPAVAGAGVLIAGTATTAALARAGDQRVQQAEGVTPLPQSHLLAAPFAVPPGLFAKKWVLLNTRGADVPCVTSMRLMYELEGGEREQVLLTFRRRSERSAWQKQACRGDIRAPASGARARR